MRISYKLKGSTNNFSSAEFGNRMVNDLREHYQWQTSLQNNVISWDHVKPQSNLLRKQTDNIRNGRIEIYPLSRLTFQLNFRYDLKISPFFLIWLVVAGPIVGFIYYQIRDVFDPPFPLDGAYFLAIGGPVMSLFLIFANYFALKLTMKSSLKRSVTRISLEV